MTETNASSCVLAAVWSRSSHCLPKLQYQLVCGACSWRHIRLCCYQLPTHQQAVKPKCTGSCEVLTLPPTFLEMRVSAGVPGAFSCHASLTAVS